MTNPTGFNGADGVFRFKPDGSNERGLAIVQISNGTTTVISPARALAVDSDCENGRLPVVSPDFPL